MWAKGAVATAIILAASTQAEAFAQLGPISSQTGLLGLRLCRAPRTSHRTAQMSSSRSDLGDMAIEMLKRVERNLGDLDDMQLATLQGLSQQVADRCHKQRGPNAVGPVTKVDYGEKTFAEIEAENDAFFGLDQGTGENLEDLPSPRRAQQAPAPASSPAPSPAPTPPPRASALAASPATQTVQPPSSASDTPFAGKDRDGRVIANTPSRVQNSDNMHKPYEEVEGGRKFSEYIPAQAVTDIGRKATPESFVPEDEWTAAYIKEFGAPPPEVPLVDDETPRPVGGDDDEFAEVRRVQQNAADYPTSEDYYEALNSAIARWRNKRASDGGLVGAVVSDRYMDQLASMKPFDEPDGGRKFSLGAMLVQHVERKGTDDEGVERGILVTTTVDPPGTLGIAGVQKGDAVLALNGVDVENYADLRREMAKIHAAGRMKVEVTIQRQAVGVPEILTVTS